MILIATVLSGGLWIAYWQGWEYARLAVVILVTLLLGCMVFLSGIAAEVSMTLVQLGIGLEGITPVCNPQDALTRFGQISRHTAQAVHFGVDADAGAMV